MKPEEVISKTSGMNDVEKLSVLYGIKNIHYIKPGIGETTRVLLRRIPWKIIIDERFRDAQELAHVRQLVKEKKVEVEYNRLNNYRYCGLIKQLSDIYSQQS